MYVDMEMLHVRSDVLDLRGAHETHSCRFRCSKITCFPRGRQSSHLARNDWRQSPLPNCAPCLNLDHVVFALRVYFARFFCRFLLHLALHRQGPPEADMMDPDLRCVAQILAQSLSLSSGLVRRLLQAEKTKRSKPEWLTCP